MMVNTEKYLPLPDSDSSSEGGDTPLPSIRTRNFYRYSWWLLASLCIFLTFSNITLLVQKYHSEQSEFGYSGVAKTHQRQQFLWKTDYSSSNRTLADPLWTNLRPGFGYIALDHEWAASQNLPDSRSHPNDPTKGLYVIDAYHQLHCLNLVRTSLLEFKDGKPQSRHFDHPTHCLDALRQSVMCHAADTPLYSWGDLTAGDGQWRECRDWTVLSRWASKHFVLGEHEPEYLITTG